MTFVLWRVFYNVVIVPLLWIAFRTIGLVDKKAARGIRGREKLFEQLQHNLARLDPKRKRVWFHSSSMGEFEQAKPIIAELKQRHGEVQIIVSFFSPSGYEHSQTYKLADVITYIPFDSAAQAKKFVQVIQPAAAVIVRYDIWPNHLWALRRAHIPTFIANATLRENTARKLPVLKQFHRALYNTLDYILTVSNEDKNVFQSFGLTNPCIEVIGDTRYDQVWKRSTESKLRQVLDPKILTGKQVLVVGSSWQEDEERLLPACFRLFKEHSEFLVLLVPHEPTLDTLERIEGEVNGHFPSIRFSNLHQYHDEKLILIDSVGILMVLYQYAHIAYVGGSFRSGVHNVLEPAAYGVPILIGPDYANSQEAEELVRESAAFVGTTEDELHHTLKLFLESEQDRIQAGKRAFTLVSRNVGATKRFLSYLEKVL
ncbi:MAG: 3-deoxy-D-manno-octulosonic acid transferase [Ignavibacteriales bacterium]|nr:3-deoxy-D-manno-octulosonic acid transferase [Ignavibacteriales bacterium]